AGLVLQRLGHEILEQWRNDGAPGRLAAQRAWVIVAHVAAEGEIRREADEPDVVRVIRRARLSRKRAAKRADDGTGTALDHTLQHGDHLICGLRVEYLFACIRDHWRRLIVPINIFATVARPDVLSKN